MTQAETAVDNLILVSSDTHVGPPPSELRKYCPENLLSQFDESTSNSADRNRHEADLTAPPDFETKRAGFASESDGFLARQDALSGLGHYDVTERMKLLDADGIACEVVFHASQNGMQIPFMVSAEIGHRTNVLSPLPHPDHQELALEGIRIYNRWLADYCSVEPHRHVGLAQIPAWDIDAAVAEVEWAHEAGLRGVNFPAPRDGLAPYNLPEWDVLWAVCNETGMPLNTHVGTGGGFGDVYAGPGARELYKMEIGWFCRRALWFMIFGGVFDRFPNLKLVISECPGDWVAATMADMDSIHISPLNKHELLEYESPLEKNPSEYFRSNCYFGASFMSRIEAESAVRESLSDLFMWGSDFPHVEGTYPFSAISLRNTFAGLPMTDIRRMVGLNAVEAFDLDAYELARVANEIGPSPELIAQPIQPEEIPVEGDMTFGFRKVGMWG